MASSERIFELLDQRPRIEDGSSTSPDPERRIPGRGTVEFQNVWFSYEALAPPEAPAPPEADGQRWVLRDVSFRVAAGEKVAFVGATGAGKTTIISLLTRLYEVTRGRILIDGVDIREMGQQDVRRRVATVLQDVFLFSGTVADNVSLGRGDVARSAVVEAARAVEMDRFIGGLRDGYDTIVRERGTNFSAGQRQLLSFARALVHGADILVLDEATSSIDTETEALVQQGIQVLLRGRTAIAIAHRLSTIRDLDRIYVLHRGRLIEQGPHEELLQAGGVYHRLYHLQNEAEQAASREPESGGEVGRKPALDPLRDGAREW